VESLSEKFQLAFMRTVQQPGYSEPLRDAALEVRLGDWTKALTSAVVATCAVMGWQASAKGHYLQMLPIARNEYLALDVMAFEDGSKRWKFPITVIELENSRDDDRIAYSLWKIVCVRAYLRMVFCYRKSADEGSRLLKALREEVIQAMELNHRISLQRETLVVVGSRDSSAAFPYGFFKWWRLNTNTGTFASLR
jgi:hypothetical protein